MSTIDTSTWSPDSSLNTDIGGIPLNADASIQQTWQAIQMLMAALKGDTSAIELTINQPDGTTIVATNQTLTVVDNSHSHTIANVAGLQTALNGKAESADIPQASSTTPASAGAASAGTEAAWARGDHVHPAQTNVSGNAGTATKLETARTISLSGDASGSASFDGSANASIFVSVADDSHSHVISNIDGLQNALDGKADDLGVVHLTGTETINGSKTFSSLLSVINKTPRLSLNCSDNTIGGALTSNDHSVYFRDKDGYNEGFILFSCNPSTGGSVLSFCAFDCSTRTSQSRAQVSLEITTENSVKKAKFRPTAIGFVDLGDATYNFKDIYASNGTIQTSDERLKTSIEPFPDNVLDAWGEVGFCQFQMRDAVSEKGAAAARLHSGLVAQRIREAFAARGLDATRYGLFCHNEWTAKEETRDADGNVVQPASDSGDRYSLRYGECLCMEAAYQRRRADRLEARIAALEESMNA